MKKVTLIDLNNFAYYPTLSIGYLIAILRKSGLRVELLSPLSQGIIARKREPVENMLHYLEQRIRLSDNRMIQTAIRKVKEIPSLFNIYHHKNQILHVVKRNLSLDTELILISSYLENYYVCKEISAYADENNIPVIIGGPAFNIQSNAEKWIRLKGVKAVIGVETDEFLGQMVKEFLNGKDIALYPGVYTFDHPKPDASYIFNKMDELPLPDFSDFPWNSYPLRIIPYMTARGCGWSKCNFCTDVTLVNGRTFRSMKVQKVLNELKTLSELYHTNYFYFLDIKLNSDLSVWNGIIDDFKSYVKTPKWACSVHVDAQRNNGLSRDEIFRAKEGGLLRISFGLESGSQRLLNHMKKGVRLSKIKQFIQDVYEAGISLRGTMFLGYPYETEEDLRLTSEFLQEYGKYFDRIRINRFGIFESAPIFQRVKKDFGEMSMTFYNNCYSIDQHVGRSRIYSFYKKEIIKQVHLINSKPILKEASDLEGIM